MKMSFGNAVGQALCHSAWHFYLQYLQDPEMK